MKEQKQCFSAVKVSLPALRPIQKVKSAVKYAKPSNGSPPPNNGLIFNEKNIFDQKLQLVQSLEIRKDFFKQYLSVNPKEKELKKDIRMINLKQIKKDMQHELSADQPKYQSSLFMSPSCLQLPNQNVKKRKLLTKVQSETAIDDKQRLHSGVKSYNPSLLTSPLKYKKASPSNEKTCLVNQSNYIGLQEIKQQRKSLENVNHQVFKRSNQLEKVLDGLMTKAINQRTKRYSKQKFNASPVECSKQGSVNNSRLMSSIHSRARYASLPFVTE